MARNLSNNMKRAVAGVCAVLVISGAAPVQPIVDFVKDSTITAKALETPRADDFNFSAPGNLVYSNEHKVATVTPKPGVTGMGNINVRYYSDASCTSEVTEAKNVGTYYVGITVSEGTNYYGTATNVIHGEDWMFTITQANDNAWTTAPTSNQQVRTLNDIAKPEAKYGTIMYRDGNGESGTYSSVFPTLTPGQHTIYCKVNVDTNFNAIAETSFTVLYVPTSILSNSPAVGTTDATSTTMGLTNNGSGVYDFRGKGANGGTQVTFYDGGFSTYVQATGLAKAGVTQSLGTVGSYGDNLEVKVVPVIDNNKVKVTYTIANHSFSTIHNVQIGSCADTMLAGDDACGVFLVDNGVKLQGNGQQLYVNLSNTSGTTRRWVGKYSGNTTGGPSYTDHVFDDGNAYTDGADSAMAFSWVCPTLAPGETKEFTTEINVSEDVVQQDKIIQFDTGVTGYSIYPVALLKENKSFAEAGLTLPVPTHQAGKDFLGWYYDIRTRNNDNSYTNTPVKVENNTTLAYSRTLYAKWADHSYTYSVDPNAKETVTANCTNASHPSTGDTTAINYMPDLTLTIGTSSANFGTQVATPTITEGYTGYTSGNLLYDFYAETGLDATTIANSIKYESTGDTTPTYTSSATKPTHAGSYKAVATVVPASTNPSTAAVTIEKAFDIRARLDLNDDRTGDIKVAKSGQVTKAITQIDYDADGSGDFEEGETIAYNTTATNAPANELYYLQNKKITVHSNAELEFTVTKHDDSTGTSSALTDYTRTFTSAGGYVYTFKIPAGVDIVKAKRVYDYSLSVSGNKLTGHDKNRLPAQADYDVAVLNVENHEYLEPNATVTMSDDYELVKSAVIKYYEPTDTTFANALNPDPVNVGTYVARAEVSTSTQTVPYGLVKSFSITPRNYALHSGEKAKTGDEITITAAPSTYDNGETLTPTVTVTDTKREASKQTLVRGTDYELYNKNTNGTYTLVTAANDATYLGQTNAGTYTIYVKFKGNYTNTGNAYVPVEWTINPTALNQLTVTVPNNPTFDYNTHPVTVEPTDPEKTLPEGAVKCEYSSDGGTTYSTSAPINVGTYTARITINNSNYTFANGQTTTTGNFTIAPKAIVLTPSNVTVIVPTSGIPTVTVSFTDNGKPGTNKQVTLVKDRDYSATYSETTTAGKANVTITALAGGNYTFTPVTKDNITINTNNNTATVELASTVTTPIVYNGMAQEPQVVVKFGSVKIDSSEYNVSYADNTNAGTATITVTDKNGGSYFVKGSTTFTIQRKNVNDVDVTITAVDPVADGINAKTPTVTVKDTVNTVETILTAGTDYTVSYTSRVNAGYNNGSFTVTGSGNYTGSKTLPFSVLSTLDISAVNDAGNDMNLITKIEYDANGDNDFEDAETIVEAPETIENKYTFVPTKTIRITSNGKLRFSQGHTVVEVEDKTTGGYIYTISINNNVNKVTATHVYDYTFLEGTLNADGNTVTIKGVDTNIIGKNSASTKTPIATVTIADVQFLDDVVIATTAGTGTTGTTVSYGNVSYTAVDGSGAELNNRKPYSAGTYKAALTVYLTDDSGTETFSVSGDTALSFKVKPRNYAEHSGAAAPADNKITAEIKNFDGGNKVSWDGTTKTPQVTVTDTKRPSGQQTLDRGTDYELYEMDGGNYTKITDTADLGETAIGNYTVYVKFIGNYTNTDNAYVPVTWKIEKKAHPTVTPPLGLTLTDNSTPQVLISAGSTNEGATLQYALGTNSTTVPTGGWTATASDIKGTKAGTYYVWYMVEGNENFYPTTPACVTAKINEYVPEKNDQTWTVTVDNYVYDGTAHEPKINGTLYGDVTYRYINTDTNEVLAEAPTAIGNYELEVTAAGTSTYNPRTWSTTYSILEKADYSVTGARFYTANTVSFKEKVEFNFLVETKDVYTAEGAYVVFTYNHYGEDVTVTKQINKADKNGTYYRVRLPLTASEMATEIKAELYLANSDKPVDTKIRSIKDYAETAIKAGLEGSDVLKAMLNYGGYTQTALGNNIDLLANSGEGIAVDVSGVAPKSATTFVRPTAAEGAKVTYKGSTTMTTSDLYVRHYFAVDSSLTTAQLNAIMVKVGDNTPVSITKLKKNSMGYYYEASPELAYELDRENGSIVVYGFEGAETADSPNAISIENYNVIDYCEAVANSSTQTVDAKNMVKALYSYYTAAKAYVESRV